VASRSTHKDVVASASANDNDNEPLYIGIGIGALCVVVVVVVVVATLAIIRRRRQRDESTAASVAAPTQSSIVISDPVSGLSRFSLLFSDLQTHSHLIRSNSDEPQ
jgi:hypothetical protein